MSDNLEIPQHIRLAYRLLSSATPLQMQSLETALKADLAAHGETRWRMTLAYYNPPLFYQRFLRFVELGQAIDGKSALLARSPYSIALRRQSLRTGIQIPPGVFAEGLSIAHYGSIIVNSRARVGALCRLHSATNIGAREYERPPTIGARVYIGPGAVIYGDIQIGDEAVIGANSVVNRDVPAGSTVAGSPARVIAERGSRQVMPDWYPKDGWKYD